METRRSAGDAAVYVETEDTTMFARAVLELIDNAPRRARMGEIGLQRSIQLVGLDRSRRSLLDAYSRLFGKSPVSSYDLAEEESQEPTVSKV